MRREQRSSYECAVEDEAQIRRDGGGDGGQRGEVTPKNAGDDAVVPFGIALRGAIQLLLGVCIGEQSVRLQVRGWSSQESSEPHQPTYSRPDRKPPRLTRFGFVEHALHDAVEHGLARARRSVHDNSAMALHQLSRAEQENVKRHATIKCK